MAIRSESKTVEVNCPLPFWPLLPVQQLLRALSLLLILAVAIEVALVLAAAAAVSHCCEAACGICIFALQV